MGSKVGNVRPKGWKELVRAGALERYNSAVPVQTTNESATRHQHNAVYASEAIGLLVIALFLLVLAVVRYCHNIYWSLR